MLLLLLLLLSLLLKKILDEADRPYEGFKTYYEFICNQYQEVVVVVVVVAVCRQ